MNKFIKRLIAFALVGVLCFGYVGIYADAATASLQTYSSELKYTYTWNITVNSSIVGGAFYRLSTSAVQSKNYKYDSIKLESCLYVNGTTNVLKTKTLTNTYTITGDYCDCGTSSTGGKGYARLTVSDSLYGSGSKIVYN